MTLRNLLLDNWSLFYHPQTWFIDEPFLDRNLDITDVSVPRGFLPGLAEPDSLPDAVLLAARYVAHPHDPYWVGKYFWCADTDSQGQRVYMGTNGKGWEIHRHIHLTDRFGTAIW